MVWPISIDWSCKVIIDINRLSNGSPRSFDEFHDMITQEGYHRAVWDNYHEIWTPIDHRWWRWGN